MEQTIPETILREAAARKGQSKAFKIRHIGRNICDTFLADLRSRFSADFQTLFISVNELQGSILTVIGLQVIGDAAQIDEVEEYLSEKYEYEEVEL